MPEMRRIAVIINGDTDDESKLKHQQNVQRALRVLDPTYETFVASTGRTAADHYYNGTPEGVLRMLADVQRTADANTEIVIYTTGHGQFEDNVSELCLGDKCLADPVATALDRIPFAKRTVIMDQCYGGNWSRLFLDDPETLFISAGSRDDTTCCARFAPFFWADNVPDLNGDGVINWHERFANAVLGGGSVLSQYLSSAGYEDAGRPSFGTTVGEVSNGADLQQQLRRLEPGQYAVVFFSASWCGFCRQFKPTYEGIVAEDGGQHLFLHTENEALAKQYGVTAFPTLMIIASDGTQYVVSNPNDLANEMTQVYLSDEQKVDIILQRIGDPSIEVRKGVLMACRALLERRRLSPDDTNRVASAVRQLMGDDRLSYAAIDIYTRLSGRNMTPAEAEMGAAVLRSLFSHSEPYIGIAAMEAYAVLAGKISARESLLGAAALRQMVAAPARGGAEGYYERMLKEAGRYGLSPERAREVRQTYAGANPVADRATSAYYHLFEAGRLPQSEIDAAAPFFRSIFSDMGKSDVERDAAADLYNEMASYISEAEARLAAPIIRGFFNDRYVDVEDDAILTYGTFVQKLTMEEAAIGSRELRAFLDGPADRKRDFALTAYSAIARKNMMSADEIKAGAPILREMFSATGGREYLQIAAVQGYQYMADKIPAEEARVVCPVLRQLLKDWGGRKWEMVFAAYKKAVRQLSPEDKRSEARLLRGSIQKVGDPYYEAYVSLLGSMRGDDLTAEAAELRQMFGVSYVARSIAVEAFRELAGGMPADQSGAMDEIAGSLRPLFLNESPAVREAVIDVYGALSQTTSADEAMEGAKALRAAFGDSDICSHAVKAYTMLAGRFDERQALEEASAMRQLFGTPLRYFEKTALVTAYGAIAEKLPVGDLISDALFIRGLLNSPLSQDAAFDTYKIMASKLPAGELLQGAAAVRSFFGTNLYFNYERVYTYAGIVANLRGDELRQEMEVLKSVFSTGVARYEAALAYVMIAESLPEGEVEDRDETLASLFSDPQLGPLAKRKHEELLAAKWLADSLISALGHIIG